MLDLNYETVSKSSLIIYPYNETVSCLIIYNTYMYPLMYVRVFI